MLGKCPKCLVRLKEEELQNLKKGHSARCDKCGKLYANKPLWIHLKLYSMFLPLVVPLLKIDVLTIISFVFGFSIIVFYHELQAYLPLVDEDELDL